MLRKFFTALLLAGIIAIPAVAVAEAPPGPAVPDEPSAAICYRGSDGFVVAPPEGWVNLPEAAAASGVCVMYAPAGFNFDNAPAVIYPRLAALPDPAADPDPVQAMVESMLEYFAGQPDGQRVEVVVGPALESEHGLRFASRYFNNGPDPNNYELVAYHAAESSMLLLVLSANTEKNRQSAEPALWAIAREILHVQVHYETGPGQ